MVHREQCAAEPRPRSGTRSAAAIKIESSALSTSVPSLASARATTNLVSARSSAFSMPYSPK